MNLLSIIKPYIKVKNRQLIKAIQILNINVIKLDDLLEQAELADSLARLNVRSKNRRKNFKSMIQV